MAELDLLIKTRLTAKRYNHTLAVAMLSKELAEQYGASVYDAEVAAMLHDVTKEESKQSQLQTLQKSDIMELNIINESENVFHAITGYLYARDILKIENTDVLNAIRYHTTGRKEMSLLEKIIFTADTVAYDRTYTDAIRLRGLAFENLDECIREITSFIIKSLVEKKEIINLDTVECYNAQTPYRE